MQNTKTLLPLLAALQLVVGCKSFDQQPDKAMYRAPGERLLDQSVDVGNPARLHWQYAWLSVASYNAIVDQPGEKEPLDSNPRAGPTTIKVGDDELTCKSPEAELKDAGWTRFSPAWPARTDPIYETLRNTHTRVQVWENRKLKTIVVSFGGTDGRSVSDWLSNLRWFVPEREDEDSIVAKQVAPQFVAEFRRRAKMPEHAYLREMKIRATGHSLGGGLAQQFAYALPLDAEDVLPKVTRVYAFNSSPVTGHSDVDEDVRTHNADGMKIDRIYERGEFLAAARAFTGLFLVPRAQNPRVRGVRYMFFWKTPLAFVSSHSMPQLACHLQHAKDRPIVADEEAEVD